MRPIKSIIATQATQLHDAPTQQALKHLLQQLEALSQQATALEQPSSNMLISPAKELLSSLTTLLGASEFLIQHILRMQQEGTAGKSDLSLLNYINAFSISATLCLQQQLVQTLRLRTQIKKNQTNKAKQQSLSDTLTALARDIGAIQNKYNIYSAPAPTDPDVMLGPKPSAAAFLEANALKIMSSFNALNAYLSKNISRQDDKFNLLNADLSQLSKALRDGLVLLSKAQKDGDCSRQAEITAHFSPIKNLLSQIQQHLAISRHRDGKVSADALHLIEEFRQLPGLFLLLTSTLTDFAPKAEGRPAPSPRRPRPGSSRISTREQPTNAPGNESPPPAPPPRTRRPVSSRTSAQEQPSSPSGSESAPPTPPPRTRRTSSLRVSTQINTTTTPEAEEAVVATPAQRQSHERHTPHLRANPSLWHTERKIGDGKDSNAEVKPQRVPSTFF